MIPAGNRHDQRGMAVLLLLLLLLPSRAGSSPGQCVPGSAPKMYTKCVSLPTQEASIWWSYDPHNGSVELSFAGTFISPSGWVAFGVNPDSLSMSGARALVAFRGGGGGGGSSLVVLPFVLLSSAKLQLSPLLSRPLDIPLTSSFAALVSSSSSAAASVRISASLTWNRTRINLIWNRGLYAQGFSPAIHPIAAADLASRAAIDLLSSSVRSTLPAWFRPAHGAINAAAWGLWVPAGAMAARYLRHSPGPAWFYVHAAVQMTGVAVGAVGFGMGVAMGGGGYALHRGLGVAAMTGGGLQAAAVFFRPGTAHRCRKYWKSYHHLVGYGLVVVGVVNVFQGMGAMGLGGSFAQLAYCLAVGTMAGACVALEANAWVLFSRKPEQEEDRAKEGGPLPPLSH